MTSITNDQPNTELSTEPGSEQNFLNLEISTTTGDLTTLKQLLGAHNAKHLLIVNTASKCGYTPQFEGLEKLYQDNKDHGLLVIGFPCNQFGGQDPASNEEINAFCKLNYGVSFPMMAKIKVNGKEAHPLFNHLKKQAPGLLGTEAIKWNFTKFLIMNDTILRFGSKDTPKKIANHLSV